ncbi:MAG: hypothetical protein VX111_17400 [Planctomycetota bacterium]|nr:hypothetical protein [Planctomycetota bacterium]
MSSGQCTGLAFHLKPRDDLANSLCGQLAVWQIRCVANSLCGKLAVQPDYHMAKGVSPRVWPVSHGFSDSAVPSTEQVRSLLHR